MGNSCQELKDCADVVCESVDEDGVYFEFKRMNLIQENSYILLASSAQSAEEWRKILHYEKNENQVKRNHAADVEAEVKRFPPVCYAPGSRIFNELSGKPIATKAPYGYVKDSDDKDFWLIFYTIEY